ncbi:MATE family efflux transporter [Wolinella succinogenes]|uniref:MATE family efflux transporter n=1 Tax=Wolinella succinogenes TaxID=844 RepID=UPI0002E285E9|nr:MATE family efflux transporter [Wolinella succinogenes]VEG81297.1 Multidrug export protein mepA [Wolinella succinogenes]HCZ19191.1 MATE family efflux transporter [Helicobacter sp.]
MSSIDLSRDSIPKLFFSYFFPALFGLFILSTYVFFDGIFVGRGVGPLGLAAVNLCVPLFYLFMSLEVLFGFGGSALASMALGRGDDEEAREIFSSVALFMLFLSSLLALGLFAYRDSLALWLGAGEKLLPYVKEYLGVIVLAAPIMMVQPLLEAFVRNDRAPYLAMSSMVVGSLSNIVLNYLFIFIFSWGLFGAALATVLGHLIGLLILGGHFYLKRGNIYFSSLRLRFSYVFRAFANGVAPALSEAAAGIVVVLFNLKLMEISKEEGVAIFGAVSYIGVMAVTALVAASQGLQPIASFNHGAGFYDRVRAVFRFSFGITLVLGFVLYALSWSFAPFLAELFFPLDAPLAKESAEAMRIYYAGYLFLGLNILSAVFFQSIGRSLVSFVISLSYNFVFILFWLELLPRFFGLQGIWLSYPLAMISGFLLVLWVIARERKIQTKEPLCKTPL